MKACPYCDNKFLKIDIIFNKSYTIKCPSCNKMLSQTKNFNNINHTLSILPVLLYIFLSNQINCYLIKITNNPKLSTVFFAFISGLWAYYINGLSPLWSKYK